MEENKQITTDLRTENNPNIKKVGGDLLAHETDASWDAHAATEETHSTTEAHSWPHIPAIQWESVYGIISNTTITTVIFFICVLVVSLLANRALYSGKKSRLRLFFLSFVWFFDTFLRESFDDKKLARDFYPLVVGVFFVIVFGNLFWLVIDWLGASVSPTILTYLRPMHSDLNTTLVLALITVFTLLYVSVRTHGWGNTLKSYFFNFSWHTMTEKCINVFVGWLHAVGIFSTLASLSLRLFGNIFAGIVLIWVISYLGAWSSEAVFELGRFATLPFWFFEVFVALVQALVFSLLIVAYVKQASAEHH